MVNLEAIDLFGRAADAVAPADYLMMMSEFTENMTELSETINGMLRPYLDHLVPCLRAWCKALN